MNYSFFDESDILLNNGLRIVTIKRNTSIVSIHCGIKIGALYEKNSQKGISHFIEHMLFKGTEKRNNETLNRDIENLGGEYNAYTDYGTTVYSITGLDEELENMVEILGDMIINSTFPKEEIEKERGVILAEINSGKDDLEDLSFKKINEVAFVKSPLKNDIIGTVNTVKSFNKKELQEFYQKYYVPNNSVVTLVSNLEHEEAVKLIEKYFGKWKGNINEEFNIVCEKNKPLIEYSYKKDIEQSTICYLYTFYNLTKREELALKILNHKLGESANCILFRQLREERGLAYDVYTSIDTSKYLKTLYIYTAVNEENIQEAISIIDNCIEGIKNGDIIFDESLVNLMKKVLKTAIACTLEDSTDLSNYILHQCIEGESICAFEEEMEKLNTIKAEEIYDVARKVFNNPTIHILKNKN